MILPLLANALSNMQEKYMEMMHCFKQAEHHFEMAKTYNDLSLQRHLHTSRDQGTIIFFEGMDYLRERRIISAQCAMLLSAFSIMIPKVILAEALVYF